MIYFIGCCVCIYFGICYILPLIIALVLKIIGFIKHNCHHEDFWVIVAGIVTIPALIGYLWLIRNCNTLALIIGVVVGGWLLIYNLKEKAKEVKELDKKNNEMDFEKRT